MAHHISPLQETARAFLCASPLPDCGRPSRMRFHAPLCVLPPCASPLPVSGPHQRPDVIPGQLLQPACVILHASGPAARSFPLASPVLPMRTAIALFPLRQALCAPVPLRSDFPPTGSPLPRHTPPVAIRRDKRTSCPTGSGPLLCPVCRTCLCRSSTGT